MPMHRVAHLPVYDSNESLTRGAAGRVDTLRKKHKNSDPYFSEILFKKQKY